MYQVAVQPAPRNSTAQSHHCSPVPGCWRAGLPECRGSAEARSVTIDRSAGSVGNSWDSSGNSPITPDFRWWCLAVLDRRIRHQHRQVRWWTPLLVLIGHSVSLHEVVLSSPTFRGWSVEMSQRTDRRQRGAGQGSLFDRVSVLVRVALPGHTHAPAVAGAPVPGSASRGDGGCTPIWSAAPPRSTAPRQPLWPLSAVVRLRDGSVRQHLAPQPEPLIGFSAVAQGAQAPR